MYKIEGRWAIVDYIFKDTNISPNAEQYEIDEAYESAETIITPKYILREYIISVEDAMPSSKNTFEHKDVALLTSSVDGSIHVVLPYKDFAEFMKQVGPGYDDKENGD